MTDTIDVVVVGAGISGLAAAWALAKDGFRVRVFEQRDRAGGRIVSSRSDGFLMEHGPNAIVAPAPNTEWLIAGAGIADQRIERGPRVQNRYLVRGGRAHALPLAPLRLFASQFFSLRGRLRLLAEPFVAPFRGDETVAAFAERRFGSEFLDYLVDPLVGGLHAGDPRTLSMEAVFPRLKRMERESGSIVAALARARLRRGSANALDPRRRMLFSFRDGLASLPCALAAALGDSVVTGARVTALRPSRAGFRLRVNDRDVTAASVVVALPAYATARLLAPLDAQAAQAAGGIAHPPLAVVFLGYRAEDIAHPLDGFGILAPHIENRAVLGLLFSSTLFADRAPAGHVALTAYVGGARQPHLASLGQREAIAMVHDEIRALLGARGAPVFARVRYWRHGLPQPGLDHARRITRLRALEAEYPGLFFAGNYLGGVSTAACIDQALAVAQRVRLRGRAHATADVCRADTPGYSLA